jgi:hypothetical protein
LRRRPHQLCRPRFQHRVWLLQWRKPPLTVLCRRRCCCRALVLATAMVMVMVMVVVVVMVMMMVMVTCLC